MKNEHGLECPVPLEYWPDWAQYFTVDYADSVFYSHPPYWDPEFKFFLCSDRSKHAAVLFYRKRHSQLFSEEDYPKCVWKRHELENQNH